MKIAVDKKKILFSVLLTVLYIAASLIVTAITSPLKTTEVTVSNFTAQIWNDPIQALLILLFIAIYYKDSDIRTREAMALRKPVILVIALFLILFAVVLVALQFSFNSIYASLYYLIIVASGEEYVFRGYLYRKLKEISSFWMAVILSGIIYGLAHGLFQYFILHHPWIVIPSNLGAGAVGALLFAFLFEKSGTLVIPILIHWLLDFCGYIF